MIWPSVGAYWDRSSLVWGKLAGSGEVAQNISPFGTDLQSIRLLDANELLSVFEETASDVVSPPVDNLSRLMRERRDELIRELRLSMGFSLVDTEEVFDGCISFLDRFDHDQSFDYREFSHGGRRIGLRRVPWGTIAAILPQNAAFYMGLIVLVNGLAAGNRVILRAPSGSYRLMAILGQLLIEAGFDPYTFCVVACDAGGFNDAWRKARHPVLMHFLGSSQRAADLLSQSFVAGKPCLIDGEGNGWIYVDQDQDPITAAWLVWHGAIRYNGQTCTSINGAVVHPAIDREFRLAVRELVAKTTFGIADSDQVGPLFNQRQVEAIEVLVQESGGRIGRVGQSKGNVCSPLLVEDPVVESDIVSRGVFGPVMWLRTGTWEDFRGLWRFNRYPLSTAILSFGEAIQEEAMQLPGASRVVLNGDPSFEDPLEPWGAYPSCGSNPVSNWIDKYYRVVQVDRAE